MPTANLTPNYMYVPYGTNVHEHISILKHPVRLANGNPVFVCRHGGAGIGGDWRLFVVPGGRELNLFCNYVLTQTAFPCDIILLETPQWDWQFPTVCTHLPTSHDEPVTQLLTYPNNVDSLKLALEWIQNHSKGQLPVAAIGGDLDIDPEQIRFFGHSHGARLGLVAMFTYELPITCLVNYQGPTDVRKDAVGLDTVHWSALQGDAGINSQATWDLVPRLTKQKLSPDWFIQRGLVSHAKPQYVIFEDVGDGIHPFGDPARPGSNYHDAAIYHTYTNLLAAASLPHEKELITHNSWSDTTSEHILQWANDVI